MPVATAIIVAALTLVALAPPALGAEDRSYYTVTVEGPHGRVLAREVTEDLADLDLRVPATRGGCWTRTGTITYNDMWADIWQVRETATWQGTGGVVAKCAGRTDPMWSRSWGLWDIAWRWCSWVDTDKDGGAGWQAFYSKGCFDSVIPFIPSFYPRIKMFIYASGDWRVSGAAH